MNTTDTNNRLLTLEECDELIKLMYSKYSMLLNGRIIEITNEIHGDGVGVKVILRNPDNTFYYPIEGRILHKEQEMNMRDAALFLVDYITLYLDEYLGEDENLFIPIDWTPYQWDAVDFQLKGQVLNLMIESLADEFIKKNS